MKDLERLVDLSNDDFERSVLRSAKRDRPRAGDRERFLASLGLAAGATAAAAPAAAVVAKASGLPVFLKWLGAGVLAGLVSGGVALQVQDDPAPPPQNKPVLEFAPGPRSAPVTRQGEARAALEAPAATLEAPAVAASSTSSPLRRAAPSNKLSAIDEEVAVLDRARNALRKGESASALAELEEHTRRFPGGVLGPEAEVLRMEALAHRDPAAAAAAARGFLQRHPQSPHAARVRTLVERLGVELQAPKPGPASSSEPTGASRSF